MYVAGIQLHRRDAWPGGRDLWALVLRVAAWCASDTEGCHIYQITPTAGSRLLVDFSAERS